MDVDTASISLFVFCQYANSAGSFCQYADSAGRSQSLWPSAGLVAVVLSPSLGLGTKYIRPFV